jgi:hypothetical protein
MNTLHNAFLVRFLLVAALCPAVSGGSLRKVWEFDLGAVIKGPLASEGIQPGILAVRFSPDGKRIAVAGNPYRFQQPVMSRLIVVQVSNPRENIQRFGIEFASDSEFFGPGGPPGSRGLPQRISFLPGAALSVSAMGLPVRFLTATDGASSDRIVS